MTADTPIDVHWNDIPMPIVTPRLIIRPAMPGDGAEIHRAQTETWNDIHAWMPWARVLEPAETVEAQTRQAYAKFILREDFRMIAIARDSGEMAVFTGLHRFDPAVRRMVIGYWTRKKFQQQGLATEAATALAHYAFGALSARTVAIDHADGNEPSRRVITRIGFRYEGRLRNDCPLPDGRVVDRLWYSHVGTADLPRLDVRWGAEP